MACYHPLKAFKIGVSQDTGKDRLKVVPYDVDYLTVSPRLGFVKGYGIPSCEGREKLYTDFVEIPCGRCLGCRLEYSRQWANRCMLEASLYDSNWFATLTYDNSHVPFSPLTGELSLSKRDFQLFMKRLRQQSGQEIRYFASGEYGGTTRRPHYHALLFNLELDDLSVYSRSDQGFTYYRSKLMDDTWQNGMVVVAPLTWDTCAYTARYVMKKLDGQLGDYYEQFDIVPEFSLMSRRPGIGSAFYDKNRDRIYEYDSVTISTLETGRTFRPPRYFDRLYDLDDPDHLASIKQVRKDVAENSRKLMLSKTDKSYLEVLAAKEAETRDKTKILKEARKKV